MRNRILIGLGIVIVVAIFIIVNYDESSSCSDVTGCSIENVVEFNIEAFRFGYTPNVIRVNQGDNVKLNIDNVDTPHGIRIPELGVSGENTVEFTANEKGEFTWRCLIPCGQGHMVMNGTIIVE
jgi:cytochrome c oxidase subunit 2